MAVLTFSMPFVAIAQQNSVQAEAATTAEADANSENKFNVSCFSSFHGSVNL